MSDDIHWAELLGVSARSTVERIGGEPHPTTGVGHGLSTTSIGPEQLDEQPSYTKLELGLHGLALVIQRWDWNPAVVRLVVDDRSLIVDVLEGASLEAPPGEVRLDTRHKRAVLSVGSAAGVYGVHIFRGDIEVVVVREPGLSALAQVAATKARQSMGLPELPTLATLLEGLGCEPWLRAAYENKRSAASLLERVDALGLVARLWRPSNAADRGRLHEWIVDGRGTSVRRVADWLSASGASTAVAGVIDCGLSSSEALADRVARLRQLARELDDQVMTDVIDAMRVDRDELESLRVVLHLLTAGDEAVTASLYAIDAGALAQRTLLEHLGATTRNRERLAAVADQDPDAWWGVEGALS